jgi:DNA-binding MarR family transcriptional regulator
MPKSFDFQQAPGHLIRRAHQVAVAVFMEETGEHDVTPVQFAILNALMDDPGEDQVTLAGRVAFDAATFGSVISRLEAKGWVRREPDAVDRRRKLLVGDGAGEQAAGDERAVSRAQRRILGRWTRANRSNSCACLPSWCRVTRRAADVLHGGGVCVRQASAGCAACTRVRRWPVEWASTWRTP